MKLNEIVDTTIKQRTVPDYQENGEDPMERYYNNRSDKSSGRYSKVKQKNNDPHMVTKTSYDPVQQLELNDGYFYYINEIKNAGVAASNPYFPRVYEVKVYKDSQDRAKFKADIEKLEPGQSFDEEQLMAATDKMFNDFESAMARREGYNFLKGKGAASLDNVDKILKTMAMLLEDSMHYQGYIKDDSLKEAIKFIDSLHRKNKRIDLDIHSENFMFRRSKFGVQLVITDPFRNIT